MADFVVHINPNGHALARTLLHTHTYTISHVLAHTSQYGPLQMPHYHTATATQVLSYHLRGWGMKGRGLQIPRDRDSG